MQNLLNHLSADQLVQLFFTAMVATGALSGLLGSALTFLFKADPLLKPWFQDGADYLQWAEVHGVNFAEALGLNTKAYGAEKLKAAIDETLRVLSAAGVVANEGAVSAAKIEADIQKLKPLIYPDKKV